MEECEALCDRLAIMVNGQFQVLLLLLFLIIFPLILLFFLLSTTNAMIDDDNYSDGNGVYDG